MGDIYDSVFRTILNDCRQLILPVINELFKEHYTGKEEIEFYPNEHFINQQEKPNEKRITDTNFIVKANPEKKYHLECQSTPDSKMLVRLFEYDAQIALDQSNYGTESLTVEFPNSAVLYLRSNSHTPNKYKYIIKTPAGTVEYDIPIIKVKNYSLQDIFDKHLYLLLPFYIFKLESRFTEYENNKEELEKLKEEYRDIEKRLEELVENGELSDFDRVTLKELSNDVIISIAAKYANVKQGVEEIMRGPLIETQARKFRDEGIAEGRVKGIAEGRTEGRAEGRFAAYIELIQEGLLSIKDAASKLGISENSLKQKMLLSNA